MNKNKNKNDYIVERSDMGDGGWSIHAPGTSDEDICDGGGLLASGESGRDADGDWLRPDASDYASARRMASGGRGEIG